MSESAVSAPPAAPLPAPVEPPKAPSILDAYVKTFPSAQNAIDLFKGEWSSILPPPFSDLKAGGVPLFQDRRIQWALGELGGVLDKTVLELGPLEGGHSYMLDRAGAASVISIEANGRAYLKCLIAKELLRMPSVRFRCGDFIEQLQQDRTRYDVIIASGVLYHMKNPLTLLQAIARRTDKIFLWTHYYDEEIIRDTERLNRRFNQHEDVIADGQTIRFYRHDYMDSLAGATFCGGGDEYSMWLSRADLLATLARLGLTNQKIQFEEPRHPHGPCLSMVAMRESATG